MIAKKHRFTVYYLLASIPIIMIFDWLKNLEIINFNIGIILKGFSVIFFSGFLILNRIIIRGFIFKNVLKYFLFINFTYSIFSSSILENIYFSIRILYWIIIVFTFYYLYQKEYITKYSLRKMIISTTIIGVFFTLFLMSNSEEHQNGSAYTILWCLPFLFYFKRTFLINLVIFLAFTAVIFTIKRGAIIALILSILVYTFGKFIINKSVVNKFKTIGLSIIVSIILVGIISLVWDQISVRLQDTGGSGRDILYAGLILKYLDSDLVSYIFGYGINSVQIYSKILYNSNSEFGVAAHSDWLQYIFDFGLLGFLFMLNLHKGFLRLVKFNYRYKTELFPSLIMTYLIFSITTVYSFILNTPDALFFGLLIAFFTVESNNLNSSIRSSNN
jgi:hypothetical protein